MTNVDSLKIESDECGFELHLTVTDDPIVDEQGRMTLNIHAVAVDLLAAVERTIAPWHREGMSVLAEMRAAGAFGDDYIRRGVAQDVERYGHVANWRPACYHDAAFACDPDEGYSRDDPKRSDWHSIHADIHDSREGK